MNKGIVTRRGVLASLLAGMLAAPLARLSPVSFARKNFRLLRPPFARPADAEFMKLCIRCGECIRVCKTNTLQAAGLEAGTEGILTPVMRPGIAGCDAACSACGEVCPTNAIARFSAAEKLTVKQGTAKLELDRCIGYTENRDCNKCVKICPTQAIKVTTRDGVDKPVRIVAAECTGCALCEQECNSIVANASACVTTAAGRGMPTDMAAIQKTLKEKNAAGSAFLPREQG